MIAFARIVVRKSLLRAVLCVAMLFVASASRADTFNIDFESFADLDPVGTIFGATFTNAIVLADGTLAGGSLNELEFPPRSLFNVGFDLGGPMEIVFSTPILSFSAYFTYVTALTVQAFTAGNVLVDSAASSFGTNLVSSGNTPNDFLAVAGANISRVLITGDALGGSFVVDDVTFETQAVVAPEPASLLLLGGALAGFVGRRLRAGRSRT